MSAPEPEPEPRIVMDDSLSPKLDAEELKSETHASKRRKMVDRTVVKVKIGEKNHQNPGKLKNEGPPSDLWSWRKYGQKPIKGSPYPRGYYKCSSSKGCSAKKQVERCRNDASMLIITYTSSHNHSSPELKSINLVEKSKEPQNLEAIESEEHPSSSSSLSTKEQSQEEVMVEEKQNESMITTTVEDSNGGDHFHYLQSLDIIVTQEDLFTGNLEKTHETLNLLLDEEPLSSYQNLMKFSTEKSEEESSDFFDELEELLPTSSVFTCFMRSNDHFDERIPVVPS